MSGKGFMKINVSKIILLDFIKLLNKREDLNFSKKMRIYCREYVHKVAKLAIRNYAFYKRRHFEEFIRELARKGELEEIPCIVCGSYDLKNVGEKLVFKIVECLRCGLRFTSPRLNQNAREMLYSRKYYFGYRAWLGQQIKSESAMQESLLAEQQLGNILIYKKKGRMLDIWCSRGELLSAAQKIGFDCWGIEPNKWACNFASQKRKLKVLNGELRKISLENRFFDVVSCMEVIEHIGDPLGELREINRILKNDGILMLTTPNFGCRESQEFGMSWRHNKPWEHIYLFDYVHLKKMLDLAGFSIIDIRTELSDGVGYPGGLLIIARKKNYKTRKRSPLILLIREGARGDVLLTTPVIRALRGKYPNSLITFKTDFPEILDNNPFLDRCTNNSDRKEYDLIYNLKYELFPEIPLIEAYARIAQIKVKNPQLEFYLTDLEKVDVDNFLNSLHVKRDKLAILHPLVGGRTKSWNREKYQHICDYFRANDYKVITMGNSADCVELKGAINLIGKLSLRQSAVLISRAKVFIGLDSFPMHVANAFEIPSVVLFGSTDPGKILIDGRKLKIVQSTEYCLGCRHDTTPDRWKQNVDCRRGRLYCMESISPDRVIEQTEEMLKEVS
jgi:ADP-heptose:LPS heptosyltransferase/2-polyprenyl-3-methyl-5-hydroxy-6-metoxy-1,4-benzoquinol methylase